MSRIERYQESIEKFINNKNILEKELKDNILKFDHLSGIILASIITNNVKKSNIKINAYYASIIIDILYYFIETHEINNINTTLNIYHNVYNLFQLSIESIKLPQKQESNYNKLISFIFSYFNSKISLIIKKYEFTKLVKMHKNDITNINYITTEIKNKLKTFSQIDKDELLNYNTLTYGNIGSLVFLLGWSLGGGELKAELLKDLQSIGENYGILYKICRDFDNIVNDISKNLKYTTNFVVNLGIQETFTIFMNIKTKIIELCLKNNMYSHTIKEVIDLLENKIDKCLKSAEIDMNSTYSSFSK